MAGSIPRIVLEDVETPSPKRRRLNKYLAGSFTDEDAVFVIQGQFATMAEPSPVNSRASEGNPADTIVCFGMVSVGSSMPLYSYLEDVDYRPTCNCIPR